MPRTLITGIAGFTGRYLAPVLAGLGHEVHGIVHVPDGHPVDGAHRLYEADLADLASVERVVSEVRPDRVAHLAGIAFVAHADVEQMYRANVVGTRQLLEALAGSTVAPKSVLIASSANVYGNSHEGLLDESSMLAPVNDYGVSKVATEYVASIYKERLPLIVVRPFNYTGRGQGSQFIIPKIVEHAQARAPVIELGNLDVARDFSDVRSIVDIYARLLTEPKAIGETFNVCSGRAVPLGDVIDIVHRISGHRFDVRVNPAFMRANEVRTLCGSATKLQQVIGRLPAIPLQETLGWMLEG